VVDDNSGACCCSSCCYGGDGTADTAGTSAAVGGTAVCLFHMQQLLIFLLLLLHPLTFRIRVATRPVTTCLMIPFVEFTEYKMKKEKILQCIWEIHSYTTYIKEK
jgi:hypothetical protein